MIFNFNEKNIPTEDVHFIPDTGLKRIQRLYVTHWWNLFLMNAIVIVSAITIVGFPVTVIASNRTIIKLLQNEHCFWWTEFKKEFRESFGAGIILGLVSFPAAMMGLVLITFNTAFLQNAVATVLGIVMLSTLSWAWIVLCYAYTMRAAMALSALDCLRNSIILTYTEWKYNCRFLILLWMAILGVFFLPHAVPVWLLGWMILIQFLACGFALPVFENKLLDE